MLRDLRLRFGVFSLKGLPLFCITALLLATAAFRIPYLNNIPMNWDEVWSIWQTLGTFEQTYQWTPSDWPPLYFLSIHVWQSMVGITPMVLRAFSLLIFLLGIPITYRAVLEMTDDHAAALFCGGGLHSAGLRAVLERAGAGLRTATHAVHAGPMVDSALLQAGPRCCGAWAWAHWPGRNVFRPLHRRLYLLIVGGLYGVHHPQTNLEVVAARRQWSSLSSYRSCYPSKKCS